MTSPHSRPAPHPRSAAHAAGAKRPPRRLKGFEHLGLRNIAALRSLAAPLLAGLGVVLLLLLFALLASEVSAGETHALDMALLRAAQRYREANPWFGYMMRDLSGLGSTVVLGLVTLATVCYLALLSARTTALLVAASTLAGAALIHLLLKPAFGRLRPDVAFAEYAAWGMSFPSGHASMSAIVFLTIGALTANTRSRWIERACILGIAAVATFLVGISRVALGVHWATDVMAGWAIGAAWATGWLLAAHRLMMRAEKTDTGGGRHP